MNSQLEFEKDIASGRMIWVNLSIGADVQSNEYEPFEIELRSNLLRVLSLDAEASVSTEYLMNQCYDRELEQATPFLQKFEVGLDQSPPNPFFTSLIKYPFRRIYDLTWFSAIERSFGEADRRDANFVNAVVGAEVPVEQRLQVVNLRGQFDAERNLAATDFATGSSVWASQFATDCVTSPMLLTCDDPQEIWPSIEATLSEGTREHRYVASNCLSSALQSKMKVSKFTHLDQPSKVQPDSRAISRGSAKLSMSRDIQRSGRTLLHVNTLSPKARPSDPERFLKGFKPRWEEVGSPEFVNRKICNELTERLSTSLEKHKPLDILLTGRAGSGKSGSMMLCALAMRGLGYSVGWIDRSFSEGINQLKKDVAGLELDVLFIDGIELLGNAGPELTEDFSRSGQTRLVFSTRTTSRHKFDILERLPRKFDLIKHPAGLDEDEVADLLDALEAFGLQGNIPEKGRKKQIAYLQEDQDYLLACLMKAVTGRKFTDIVRSEIDDLTADQRDVYEIVCFLNSVTNVSEDLSEASLLQLINSEFGRTQQALSYLASTALFESTDPFHKSVRCKHRVIADAVVENLEREKLRSTWIQCLEFFAARARPDEPDAELHKRYRRRLMNHRQLHQNGLNKNEGRILYQRLQPNLEWDYHYWLQRASFYVLTKNKIDDVIDARSFIENALETAKREAINKEWSNIDYAVETKAAEIDLLIAIERFEEIEWRDKGFEAVKNLVTVTKQVGSQSPHTFTALTGIVISFLELCCKQGIDPSDLFESVDSVFDRAQQQKKLGLGLLEKVDHARRKIAVLAGPEWEFPVVI